MVQLGRTENVVRIMYTNSVRQVLLMLLIGSILWSIHNAHHEFEKQKVEYDGKWQEKSQHATWATRLIFGAIHYIGTSKAMAAATQHILAWRSWHACISYESVFDESRFDKWGRWRIKSLIIYLYSEHAECVTRTLCVLYRAVRCHNTIMLFLLVAIPLLLLLHICCCFPLQRRYAVRLKVAQFSCRSTRQLTATIAAEVKMKIWFI